MLSLPIGMLVAKRLLGVDNVQVLFDRYGRRPALLGQYASPQTVRIFMYALSLCCLAAIAYTVHRIPMVPIFHLLSSQVSTLQLQQVRNEILHIPGGVIYVKNILALQITPIVSYIAYIFWRRSQHFLDFFWFVGMLLAAVFMLTLDLEKSPVVLYFIGYLFIEILLKGQCARRMVLFMGAIALCLVMLAYVYIGRQSGSEAFLTLNHGLGGRLIFGQVAGTFLSFSLFGHVLPFIGLHSLSHVLSHLFGTEYAPRAARQIMLVINPIGVANGQAGVVNSLFIAEAWANFGLWGVLLAPLYVGFLLEVFFISLLRLPKTAVLVAIFAYYSVESGITGGFNNYLYNPQFVLMLAIFGGVAFVSLVVGRRYADTPSNVV